MLSNEDRLRQAQKNMDALSRMQSPNASILKSRGNVVLPNKTERTDVDLAPEKIIVQSAGPQDDDMRLSINGVSIFDPKQCVLWYKGDLDVGPDFNTNFRNSGFRLCIVTRSEAIKSGAQWELGATVDVDTFDGWGGSYRTSPWTATVILSGGSTSKYAGGISSIGSSVEPRPQPTGDYYRTGPHFESYYPNGSFTLN